MALSRASSWHFSLQERDVSSHVAIPIWPPSCRSAVPSLAAEFLLFDGVSLPADRRQAGKGRGH